MSERDDRILHALHALRRELRRYAQPVVYQRLLRQYREAADRAEPREPTKA